jgi:circadian clock protein KaiC
MSAASSPEDRSFKRVPSGISGLDTILGGGVFQGGIYILLGAPGTGKTILSNQICFHHAAAGGRALFVTLLAENHARMIGNLHELSFFDEARIPDQLTYLSAFHELRESGLKGVIDLLRREIQRSRSTMLVIDGLISLQSSAESDMAFKEFVHDLQEIALATDCTMFLTTSTGNAVSPEQTMVDGLIELRHQVTGSRSESTMEVLKFRGSGFLRGPHAYKITQAGIVVFPRIEILLADPTRADERVFGRTSTGNHRLDSLLGGGVPAGSTTMIMGPSGIGKTTLGLQFLSRSSKAEPGMMFGFYETPARLNAKAAEICAPLRPLFDTGLVELLWQTPTSDVLDAYGGRLLEAVHRRKVKRLFIDGLTGFKNAAIEPSRVGHFFTALANELRMLGVTTFYSLEVPDILGPAIRVPIDDLSSLAENMILLRYIELRSRLYRLISIMKVRDSDFDTSLYEFAISRQGVEIHDTPESAEAILSSLNLGGEPTGRKSPTKRMRARSGRRGT